MSTGIDCQLWVDGQRLPDGCLPGEDPTAPVALSGLAFTWGRSTSLDQPGPSTCSFSLSDAPGGSSFASTLRTGLPVQVLATGLVSPPPTVSTIPDPDFSAAPPGSLPGNIRATGNSRAEVSTVQTLLLRPTDGTSSTQVQIAPGTYSSDPAAWDAVPATSLGETWRLSVDVNPPAGGQATVQAVLFADPTGNRVTAFGPVLTQVGPGWGTLTADVHPPAAGGWVGVRVRVFPTGYSWLDTPGTWLEQVGAWQDYYTTSVDNVQVLAPAAGTVRTVLAFDGRISDMQASWDEGSGASVVEVTAVDFTADLANVKIGDEPWPQEAMGTRFQRVLNLAAATAPTLAVDASIDATVSGTLLGYQDVDAQPVTGLLQDYAASVDAVMWSAVHMVSGPYLRVEDPANRPPGLVLSDDTGSGLVEIVPSGSVSGVTLSACDVLREPVTWVQSVSDVATGSSVTWQEDGTDSEGQPTATERTETVVDSALEAIYGQRRVSLSTLLAQQPDAVRVAQRILARASFTGWRAGGLTIDDTAMATEGPAAVQLMLQLLDGTARNGMPVLLTDLPEWSPAGVQVTAYLEGATCSYEGGAWVLELVISSPQGLGSSVTWAELDPAWRWGDFDPAISWSDLVGVGPEIEEVAA